MPVAMVEALCSLTKSAVCSVCGRPLVWLRADARYCGPTCKKRAYRARAAR
jgi:hypothetical protein